MVAFSGSPPGRQAEPQRGWTGRGRSVPLGPRCLGIFLTGSLGPGGAGVGFFGGVSHWEILVILLVILLVFGRRVPEVMRSLGRGVTQFKKGLRDVEDEVQKELDESDKPAITGPAQGNPPASNKEATKSESKELEG